MLPYSQSHPCWSGCYRPKPQHTLHPEMFYFIITYCSQCLKSLLYQIFTQTRYSHLNCLNWSYSHHIECRFHSLCMNQFGCQNTMDSEKGRGYLLCQLWWSFRMHSHHRSRSFVGLAAHPNLSPLTLSWIWIQGNGALCWVQCVMTKQPRENLAVRLLLSWLQLHNK